MYDIADLKTLLSNRPTSSGYTVKDAKTKQSTLVDVNTAPVIYLGYSAIDSKNPTTPESENIIDAHGEDLVQTFDIIINCASSELPIIWKNLYTALIGQNTQPLEDQFTGLSYKQGGIVGLENGRMEWLDRWAVAFPTASYLV